ncbi:hypothetical protein OG242_00420 [Streptomyces sp. NBC_00727]|uniref:hypothetical protein n=1 Tax=Streptomyces sp. NBC_00727 TaxID=2903675 RepID=UPI0038663893
MADVPVKTPIQSKYAQQYADDLAVNRREQEDVTAQVTALRARLEQLKVEEGWLAKAQGTLPVAPLPAAAEAEPSADATRGVPQQRQDQAVAKQPEEPVKKKSPSKKTAARRTAARKTAAQPAKRAAARKPETKVSAQRVPAAQALVDQGAAEEEPGRPLWQLILEILLKTPGQPYVAREVHDQLAKDHPSRKTSAQTVRNNLETLVKKSLAEKSRQQGNVMYTAPAQAGPDAADVTADSEPKPAPTSAVAKDAVQV